MKQCLVCSIPKPVSEFHMKRGKPQARCKECRSKYMAKRYQDNIELERRKRKGYYESNRVQILAYRKAFYAMNAGEINLQRRLKKYGLSREQFFTMLENQDYKCANKHCRSGNKDLAIDHCHNSLEVRGILCDNCNTALGLLKESSDSIDELKEYLTKYQK